MPKMSGEEAFLGLRKLCETLPIVVTSGCSEQEAMSRFAGKDLTGFLSKPFVSAQLVAALRRAIGSNGRSSR
jgi:FixJ family two-component response regulator